MLKENEEGAHSSNISKVMKKHRHCNSKYQK